MVLIRESRLMVLMRELRLTVLMRESRTLTAKAVPQANG